MLFIISNSDGDTTVTPKTEAEFLQELNDGDYGDSPVFLTSLDREDTNYWPEGALLLIRGEIIQPRTAQVVKEYKL